MTFSSGEIRVNKANLRQTDKNSSPPSLDHDRPTRSEGTLIGQVLDGRYTILECIGSGGMSVVYKAHHTLLDRTVAIKVLHANRCDADSILRFQQEARALSALDHANLIKVHAFGQTGQGNPYLVMDFVEGHTLAELIVVHGALPRERALPIFKQICASLAHAHERGIVHRDLKPSNIIIDPAGTAKILDFGIAKLLPDAATQDRQLTRNGATCGSPPYMSPEQCLGERLDARSDIYSLGCVFYETAGGRKPFTGKTSEEIMLKHLNEAPRPLAVFVQLPDSLEAIIYRCLEKEPKNRYKSVSDVLSHLNVVGLGGSAEAAVLAESCLDKSRANDRRRRLMRVGAGIAAALCALSIAGTAAFLCWSPQGKIMRLEPRAKTMAKARDLPRLITISSELLPLYEATGKTQRAVDLTRNIVALARATLAPESKEYAEVMTQMGDAMQRFDQKEAQDYYGLSLQAWDKIMQHHLLKGNMTQQISSLEQCIRLCIQSGRRRECINYLIGASVLYKGSNQLAKAKVTATKAVELARQLNDNSRDSLEKLLLAQHQLAEVLIWSGDPGSALPLCEDDGALAEKLYPASDFRFAGYLKRLADCYSLMRETGRAKAVLAKIPNTTPAVSEVLKKYRMLTTAPSRSE